MKQLLTRAMFGLLIGGSIGLTSCSTTDPEPAASGWQRTSDFPGGYSSDSPVFTIGTKGYVLESDFWEFDLATGMWTEKTDMPASESDENAFSFAIGGKGYVGTGGLTVYTKDVFEYDPATDSWTKMNDFPATARYGTASFAIGDKGYVIGGDDHTMPEETTPNSFLHEVWEYTPATDTWVQKADFPGHGRANSVSFSINGKGYIGTGYYVEHNDGLAAGIQLKDFWEYDPATDKWSQKADFPGGERYEATGFALNGKGYLGTGFHSPMEKYSDWWEYDPATDKWTKKAAIGINPRYSAFSFGLGDRGFIGGGSTDESEMVRETNSSFFWEYILK